MATRRRSAPSGATLPDPGADRVLYLVDLSNYVFRAYHAIAPLSSSKGEPTHAVLGTVNMLQKVVVDRRPHSFAVAMDSKGPTFRHELDPAYKANRPPPPPDLSQQMSRCEAVVRAYNIPVYQRDGVEADDLIAAVVKRASAEGYRVVIVSADKDLMQLVCDDQVLLWDSMRDKVYGPAEVKEKLGVPPNLVRDYLALTGDTSDNVPGVPSVGPKTATDLLTQFGSLDTLYTRLAEVARAKLRETLAAHEADARLSQRLVTLDAALAIDWDPLALRYGGANEPALRALFQELEFHRLLEHLAPHRDKGEQSLPEPSPALPPTTTVLDEVLLGKIAEGARTSGVLAFHTVGTSPEPMRAALVGLGLAVGPGECFYLPVAHRSLDAPKQLPWERIQALLGPVFGDAAVKKCCHDLKYSEVLLARHGIALAGPAFDPMLASYLLDPESPSTLPELTRRDLGITLTPAEALTSKSRQVQLELDDASVDRVALFAASRAAVTLVLAERYEPRLDREGLGKLLCDVELPLLRVLSAMEQRGVLVDVQKLQALGVQVDAELRAIEGKAKALVGADFAIRSRDRLETLLFDTMKLRVVKKTPKGGRSTDAEVLEELASEHPIARLVLEHRELDKLKGTYIEALPRAVNGTTGRIHTSFGQATAATGRLSSNDPNLQNIPIRTELGRSLREAFVAPAGHVILSADYSQVELRVLAHLSLDPALVDAFSTGADVHRRTAALVFDRAEDKVTPEMRRQAKVINFGVIYGMGDSALAKQLGITRADAAKFIASYFERYKGVAQFFERTVEAARQGEAVRTLLGRRRFLPNLTSGNRGLRAEAERIAKNTAVQGTAADILKLAMVRLGVGEVVPGARMILTVHDELVFEVPVEGIDAASDAIREAMETACKLAVPLVVDIHTGANWAQAH